MATAKKGAQSKMSHSTEPVEPPVTHSVEDVAEPEPEPQAAPAVADVTPESHVLRCRCGSERFMAPAPVAFYQEGDEVRIHHMAYNNTDPVTFICLGCSDAGTMAQLTTRLLGIQPQG